MKCNFSPISIEVYFKRFEDMQMLRHPKILGIVQMGEPVWKQLSTEEKTEIEKDCGVKLIEYIKD